MSVHTGWEQHRWGGARGLREERSRARRRLKWAALIGAGFVYCLLQVRVTTEVASIGSRISNRQAEVKRLEVDLAVARTELAQRQIFGQLIAPAQLQGFGPGGEYRTIPVTQWASQEPAGVWRQLEGELQRGAELLLPAALAQEVLTGDPQSSERAHGRNGAAGRAGGSSRPGNRSRALRP